MPIERVGASFRDPFARLYVGAGDELVRGLSGPAAQGFIVARDSGWLARATAAGQLVGYTEVTPMVAQAHATGTEQAGIWPTGHEIVLTHPILPHLTYPWEWTFHALRQAALLHLDLQLSALECGIVFRDARACNIVFDEARPVFVDYGSFAPYEPGMPWVGLSQFCCEFVNPLLLESRLGLPLQPWYRGNPTGLASEWLSRMLPWTSWLSPRLLTLVHLQGRWQSSADVRTVQRASAVQRRRTLSQSALRAILEDMRHWVQALRPARRKSVWSGYAGANSYLREEAAHKAEVVAQFVRQHQPCVLTDLGCNTGEYSRLALESGAGHVIGVEGDGLALDEAQAWASAQQAAFTAVVADIADPSPAGGWLYRERIALAPRIRGDALLALALVHHLVLGRNLPLDEVLDLLCGLAPRGLLEYVPCDDPMAQALLALRPEPAAAYDEAEFMAQLSRRAHIVRSTVISRSGRKLIEYEVEAA